MKNKLIGWTGAILVQAAVIPPTIMVILGYSTDLPPITMTLMIWSGLICYFVYACSIKDKIYMTSNGIGVTLQTLMLYLIATH